jgi:hypothetical protein
MPRVLPKTCPPPLVRGDDLILLGLKPGPKFGELLEAVAETNVTPAGRTSVMAEPRRVQQVGGRALCVSRAGIIQLRLAAAKRNHSGGQK